MFDQETQKRMAAEVAAEYVEDGNIVGLGTGSTVKYVIEALGRKVSEGLNIKALASSVQTEELAKSFNIPLVTLSDVMQIYNGIDIAIDGADQVDKSYNIIKGGGGALHREKIVMICASLKIIVVDHSKMVKKLDGCILPVEVTPFSHPYATEFLAELGLPSLLRLDAQDQPFVTDNGNYILDCQLHKSFDLGKIMTLIPMMPGAVDHGLFVGLADLVIVGGPKGVKTHEVPKDDMPSEEDIEKFLMRQLAQ